MDDDTILADSLFWMRIDRATSARMAAASEKELRRQWIDDFAPESCKPSNDGRCVEGSAYAMGHPNGKFGAYRTFALVSWSLVRHRDRNPAIEQLDLDHTRKELFVVVSAASANPNQSPRPTTGWSPAAAARNVEQNIRELDL